MGLREIGVSVGWKRFADGILSTGPVSPALQSEFHTLWTVEGHKIRSEIGDDSRVADFLWQMLPSFDGQITTLYRGENLDRWSRMQIGFSWTPSLEVAKMFARGLNALCSGGILLKVDVDPSGVIAGPSAHSLYLNELEFTLDPRVLNEIEVLERFSPLT